MTQRLLADDVTRLPLDHEPLPGDEVEDGERLRLGPGTVVRLRAGDRTRWLVDEPLRKVWVA